MLLLKENGGSIMTELRDVLEQLAQGKYTVDEAEMKLRLFNIIEIGRLAKLDAHRETRKGIPEVVWARHKTEEEARQCWRERYGEPARPLTPADLAGAVVRRCTAPGVDGYPVTFWTTLLQEPE